MSGTVPMGCRNGSTVGDDGDAVIGPADIPAANNPPAELAEAHAQFPIDAGRGL